MTKYVHKTERKPGSGRKAVMNVVIRKETRTVCGVPQEVEVVDWTCPKTDDDGQPCNFRNIGQRWYGRDDHICGKCEQWTNIKGVVATPVNPGGVLA